MGSAPLHLLVLLIVCSPLTVIASKWTANEKEDRGAIIENAIAEVIAEFSERENARRSQVSVTSSAKAKLHSFKLASAESLAQGKARLKFEKMVKRAEKEILEKQRHATIQTTDERIESIAMEILHRPGSILTEQEVKQMYRASGCNRTVPTTTNCNSIAVRKHRTANGVCNNLQNPTFGAANTPLRRLIPSRYDDGIGRLQGTLQIRRAPIVPGPYSPPNPSPRVVSLGVINDKPFNDSDFTHILMQWGQFLDHDLDLIPEFHCPSGCSIDDDRCVPFPVPKDDIEVMRSTSKNSSCHRFARSMPACNRPNPTSLTPREQINALTHFIDGSMIYHHNPRIQRTFIRNMTSPDGLLNVGPPATGTKRPSLPLISKRENNPEIVSCPNMEEICFLAGDTRVNEQTALTVMHTIWLREHNRIALLLRTINPRMSSDAIFQTAQKIVIAEIQKVTYKDYLPIILGAGFLRIGNYRHYNSAINPSIPNAFATAAYRFGHSQIQPFLDRLDENYKPIPAGPLSLVNAFFNGSVFLRHGGTDPILRGLLTRNARQVDEFLNSVLTNRLFSNNTAIPGLDLASLNIQRGRDHGLPKYLTWKQWAKKKCNFESEFRNELTHVHLLQAYGSLNNVDLFVGGLAEKPLPKGLVGAVFACIFSETFSALRDGDRFYYENAGLFTLTQRTQIEKSSLSRVICDNTDIKEVQPNAFSANQQRVSCSQIPSIDLNQWKMRRSLPRVCYIKINAMNSRRSRSRYSAISRFFGMSRNRVSRRRIRGMRNGCLRFTCPQPDRNTRLIVSSSNRCRVQVNGNLKNPPGFSRQYRQSLSVEDISSMNGLYESFRSCRKGRVSAVRFCRGDVKLASSLEDLLDVSEQSKDDLDKYVSDDKLHKEFGDIQDDDDEVKGMEDKTAKFMGLIQDLVEKEEIAKKDNTPMKKEDGEFF